MSFVWGEGGLGLNEKHCHGVWMFTFLSEASNRREIRHWQGGQFQFSLVYDY